MATAYVTFGSAPRTQNYADTPCYDRAAKTETVSTSGSAAYTSGSADRDGVVTVYCDSALYARPTASSSGDDVTATNGRYVPAATLVDIAVKGGDYLSLIDV